MIIVRKWANNGNLRLKAIKTNDIKVFFRLLSIYGWSILYLNTAFFSLLFLCFYYILLPTAFSDFPESLAELRDEMCPLFQELFGLLCSYFLFQLVHLI